MASLADQKQFDFCACRDMRCTHAGKGFCKRPGCECDKFRLNEKLPRGVLPAPDDI